MSFTVADLQAILRLNKSDFSSGLKDAEGDFEKTVSKMEAKTTKSSKGLGIAGAAAVGGIAGAAVGAVSAATNAITGTVTDGLNAYKDLEDAASSAAAKAVDVNGKSNEEIKAQYDELKTHVMGVSRDLGASTVFDPTQVASAFDEIAGAGYDVSKVGNNELRPMLDLAASDMEYGLGNATKLTMSTLSQFGLTMEDSARVADVYAKGAAGSAASLSDFEYAMKYVAPVANEAGMSLEETTSIIGKLADKGYQGEMSGTALRTAILRLGDPTNEMIDTLEKYGLAYDDINPRTHSFIDTLELLKKKGVDVYDFGEIFGKEGAAIISATAGMTSEVKGFTKELENAKGVAKTMADLKMDSLGGVWEEAKGAASELSITLGENLKPAAESVLKAFSNAAPKIKEFMNAMFKGDIKKMGSLVQEGFQSAISYLRNFGTEFSKTISSIDFASIGKTLGDQAVGLGKIIWDGLVNTDWASAIKTIINLLIGGITAFASFGLTIGKAIFDGIVSTNWVNLGTRIWDGIKSVTTYFVSLGTSLFNTLNNVNWGSIGSNAAKSLQSAISSGIDALSNIGSKISGFISNFKWSSTGKDVGEKIKSGIETISGWATKLKEGFLGEGWEATGQKIGNAVKDGINQIKEWYSSIKDSIFDWAKGSGPKELGQSIGEGVVAAIKTTFELAKNGIAAALDLANAIKTHFEQKGGGNIIAGVIQEAKDWISVGTKIAGDIVAGFIDGIEPLAASMYNSIVDAAESAIRDIGSQLPDWTPGRESLTGFTVGRWEVETKPTSSTGSGSSQKYSSGSTSGSSTSGSSRTSSSKTTPSTSTSTSVVGTTGQELPQISGKRGSSGSIVGHWMSNKFYVETGAANEPAWGTSVETWIAQQQKLGYTWESIEDELKKISGSGGSNALSSSNIDRLEKVYKTISYTGTAGAKEQSKITTQSAQTASNIGITTANTVSGISTNGALKAANYVTLSGTGLYSNVANAGSLFAITSGKASDSTLETARNISANVTSTFGSINNSLLATNMQTRDVQLSAANSIAALGLTSANNAAAIGQKSVLDTSNIEQNSARASSNTWGSGVDLSQFIWTSGVQNSVGYLAAATQTLSQTLAQSSTSGARALQIGSEVASNIHEDGVKNAVTLYQNINGKVVAAIGSVGQDFQNYGYAVSASINSANQNTLNTARVVNSETLSTLKSSNALNLSTALQTSSLHLDKQTQISNLQLTTANQSATTFKNGITTSGSTFKADTGTAGSKFISDINSAGSSLATGLGNAVGTMTSMITTAFNGLSFSSSGFPSYYSGSSGSNGGNTKIGTANQTYTDCLFEGFVDSCTNVSISALKYTNPQGQTYYINPMTYHDTGGVSSYMSSGSSSSSSSSGMYDPGYQLPAIFSGYAEGGISTSPQVATVSERGHPEIHLTQKNVDDFFGLKGSSRDNMTIIFEVNGKTLAKEVMPYAAGEMKRVGIKVN